MSSATAARVADVPTTWGASLSGETWTAKLAEVELTPSLTVTVTVAVPNAWAMDCRRIVRSAEAPESVGGCTIDVSL
ncbi:MAG: hypothetical protein LW712_08555, partial [Burkholderiaceae bacterium]|nr:hypothetical protein [Burkholderiaceae bacterium]